jgi:S-adenosylmethionine-diacylgycerolhomoserine-N-methlytransferase
MTTNDTVENMDRMYRYQRYFYDATRKFYLLGRDRLLAEISPQPDENILEVGCGTARNLLKIATAHSNTNFFGLDASTEMLRTAQAKLDAQPKQKNICLRNALADDFSYEKTFGLEKPFDKIFFSYSISMIPTWRDAVQNSLTNLKSGGAIFIVDFYDMKDLPAWFQKLQRSWLRRFHVQFWNELIPYLEELEKSGNGKLSVTPLYRRYSFIAKLEKN